MKKMKNIHDTEQKCMATWSEETSRLLDIEEIDQDENRIAEILEVQTLKLQSEPQCIEINYEELYLNLTIQYFRKLINKLQTA